MQNACLEGTLTLTVILFQIQRRLGGYLDLDKCYFFRRGSVEGTSTLTEVNTAAAALNIEPC
jgi:hypothetical protein